MQVQAKCFLDLSRDKVCDFHGSTPYELADGATARDLAVKVGLKPEEVKLIFVNHVEKTLDSKLKNGDEVAFSPY
jgi:molybdopterin converting factor small subunit